MRTFPILKASTSLAVAFLLLLSILVEVGCKKTIDSSTSLPTKFTELQINPSFLFDSYINLDVTIDAPNTGGQLLSVIQIYQEDPRAGGKLIATGATDAGAQYKTSLRVPSRLKELWVCRVSPLGVNEYVAVPVSGTMLTYTFGKSGVKSTESNDCNTGTPIATSGSYTVNSGQIYVVQPGVTITTLSLTINTGGTVRVCGTANITGLNGSGTLIVSPSGSVTIPVTTTTVNIDNYGTTNFAQSGNEKTFNLASNATLHNWGVLTISNSLNVKGTLINEYHTTIVEKVQTAENGRIINYCQLFINSNSNEEGGALKIATGSAASPGLVNNANAYLKVTGGLTVSVSAHVSLGLQSLVETGKFDIEGSIDGPASQGSQVHALGSSESRVSSATFTGYIDFWATSISPKSGTFGTHITWHNPGYTIPAQNCGAPVVPVITSTLVAAGNAGTPVTPYVLTATGTDPITYNATNLPAGLTFNASTHTISGTPTTAQVKSVTLTADNLVGTSTKTLVFTILAPGSAPIITSSLTAHTPISQQFNYTIISVGTTPITYNATSLPSGLTFNATTHEISGIPASAGVFNIAITATNTYGSDNKTLVLTVGNPPVITSVLTANGVTGQQFTTYTLTASGTAPVTLNATNLPAGLQYSEENHTINGTTSLPAVVNVTLTATSEYGNDSKILVITIIDPVQPPTITSPLLAAGVQNQPLTYELTATGTHPIVYNATNLPTGLTFNQQYNVISGIPTQIGPANVTLTATNSAGISTKTLVLNIVAPAIIDSDGDGVADALDAYPNDATRAFNSYYPNELDFATYAFEDLWPAYGDYDCNDLVMNFNYKIVTNAQNKVVDLIARFKVKAAGASFDNGFGVALSTAPANVESVTGCIKVGTVVNIDPKGYEAGHTTNTVIIPVDAVNTLLGRSIINTVHGGYTVQTAVQTVTVHLSNPQTSIGTLPYNPFIFINQNRGKEVHLKDHAPTQLANPVYFGSLNDASNPAVGHYYRSATGLPWGLEIPVDFSYPVEKADIVQTYLHFAQWAQSSGASYSDWYMDKPGYRNSANIY